MSLTKVVKWVIFFGIAFAICEVFIYFILPKNFDSVEYSSTDSIETKDKDKDNDGVIKIVDQVATIKDIKEEEFIPVTHIETPKSVKAVYVSSWVAGSKKYFYPIVKMIDDTELNAIVIDIKDSTGRIGFDVSNEDVKKYGAVQNRIPNIRLVTSSLHHKNIYIIGRVAVFQDPYLTKVKPEWAITRKSDGDVWKDNKGLSFLDPTNEEVRKYIRDIALASYDEGFDEINFDYIRYPSDGNMKDINYNLAPGKTRADNIEDFFKYISSEVKKDKNIPISGDLFGLTTEGSDDMGIGQVWEKALPYFDFLAPMVYPSHYYPGHLGFKNPSMYPYEVVDKAISSAILRTKVANQDVNKIRPWLQDFDMGATYTAEMVRAQIKAVDNQGLSSWMLWDPSNKYTPSALELEKIQ